MIHIPPPLTIKPCSECGLMIAHRNGAPDYHTTDRRGNACHATTKPGRSAKRVCQYATAKGARRFRP